MTDVAWRDRLLQDLRLTARQCWKAPGVTAAAILTLAIGIGINTAVFTLLYALTLRALPLPEADRIVQVFQGFDGQFDRTVHGSVHLLSYPEYTDYRDRSRTLDGLAAYTEASLTIGGTQPEAGAAVLASCNYFQVLKAPLALGRAFAPDECRTPGGSTVAILSHGLWQRRFGANPGVINATLVLNEHRVTVVGVAAREFAGTSLRVPDVWVPLTLQPLLRPNRPRELGERDTSWLMAIGRLAPGVTRDEARADLALTAQQHDLLRPGRRTAVYVEAGAYVSGPEVRRKGPSLVAPLAALLGLLFVMACANVMHLLLARAAARHREMGVRLALGASRARLVRQLLTESSVLALLGGAAGLSLAWWLPPLLLHGVGASHVRIDLTPDLRVFAYALGLAWAAVLTFGLVPALRATRIDVASTLKDEQTAWSGAIGASRLRSSLVAAQVAGCLLLLVVAGLLVRSVRHAEQIDPGFVTTDVLALSFDLERQGYDAARAATFYQALEAQLATIASVRSVGRAGALPLAGQRVTPVTTDAGIEVPVAFTVVSPGYFRTLGVPLLRGRVFTDQEARGASRTALSQSTAIGSGVIGSATSDSGTIDRRTSDNRAIRSTPTHGTARPVVISAAMAQAFWPGREALGQSFEAHGQRFTVGGIAQDARNLTLSATDGPFFYDAASPDDPRGMVVIVHAPGRAASVAAEIPALVRRLDAALLVTTTRFEDRLAILLQPSRTAALLSVALGLFAMLLAVIGVYGIVSYSVSQRTREMGVRLALGAHPRDIVSLIVRQGALPVAIGLAIGLLLATAASSAVSGMLFGISALDPIVYVGTIVLLAMAALLAMWGPARRAARVDPMATLRQD